MAKIESANSPRSLDIDRQVRLKLFGAKVLKIKDVGQILRFNEIDDMKVTDIPESIFPSTRDELIQRVS